MMSTKTKLLLATAGCIVVICLGVVLHYLGASNARKAAEDINRVTIPEILALQDMRFGVVRIVASTTELLLIRTGEKENEQAEAGEWDFIEQGKAIFTDALRRYTILHQGPVKLNDESFIPSVTVAYDALLKTSHDLIALSEQGAPIDEIVEGKEVFEVQERAILEIIDTYYSVEIVVAKRTLVQSVLTIDKMVFLTVAIGAIAVAIFIGYGIYVIRVMRKLIAEASDRKQAEEKYKESRDRLHGSIKNLQEGFALFDADDRLVALNDEYRRVSPAAEKIMKRGGSFEDVIRANVARGVVVEAKGREEEFIQERLKQHQNPKGSFIRRFTDGQWYMLQEVHTPEGGIALSFIDITDLKKGEESIRRLAEAIEGLSENFALYGPDDRLIICNKGYREINEAVAEATTPGTLFEDHLRAMVEKGLAPEAVGREEEWLRERLERHRNPKGPFELRRQDGIWLLIHDQRMPDGSTATISTDISQLKRTENALRESEERHKLFAADVAHELRTPLAVMRSQLDNVEDTEINQSLLKDVDVMSRLVSQLMTATRLELLTVNSNDEADLHAIGIEVAKYLGPIAIKEGRSIEVTGTQHPVIIRGNDDILEMAVRNLVENAIRYSARETVVTIQVSDEPAISVINHGQSIPPEQQKVIFQRFKRSDQRGGGAGIGLSIVQRVVEAHQATIYVSDVFGGGAEFKISFPSRISKKVDVS